MLTPNENPLIKYGFDKCTIDNFLPSFQTVSHGGRETDKIKLRILCHNISTINVVENIIKLFDDDTKYDTLLLIRSVDTDMINFCAQNGYNYMFVDREKCDYLVEYDKPDILILYHYTDLADYGDLRGNTKLLVALCSHVNSERFGRDEFWNYLKTKSFGKYHPDYFLFDTILYQNFKEVATSDNLVEMGNPKFDGIFAASKKKIRVKAWDKLEGKKILLWCPDHGIYNYRFDHTNTFDIYGKTIFQWGYNNPSVGIIFRPHLALIGEMLRHKFWSEDALNLFKYYIYRTPNIVWDEHYSYNEAFSYCDAILTDAFCGITCTALPLGKPLAALYRDKKLAAIHPEINNSLYEIKDKSNLYEFFNMFISGKDPKKRERETVAKKYIMHFDGKNSERFKVFIDEKYAEKFGIKTL